MSKCFLCGNASRDAGTPGRRHKVSVGNEHGQLSERVVRVVRVRVRCGVPDGAGLTGKDLQQLPKVT